MIATPSPIVPFKRDSSASEGSGSRGSGIATQLQADREGGDFLVVDSCHSTWVFDTSASRFRRILKGLDLDPSLAATDWREYDRIEMSEDSEAFVVVLNAAGSRRIRSWRHGERCEHCEGETTAELSLEDIRRVAHA